MTKHGGPGDVRFQQKINFDDFVSFPPRRDEVNEQMMDEKRHEGEKKRTKNTAAFSYPR